MASYSRGLNSIWLAFQCGIAILSAAAAAAVARAEDPFEFYELAIYDRPAFKTQGSVSVFPEGMQDLWLRALERPDAELRRLVIDTLAIAHLRGMKGIEESIPRLIEIAGEPEQRLDVARAVAQTLITLDAREQAELLGELASRHGLTLAQIVEPALERWESPVIKDAWLERVTDANASESMMLYAIRGLATLKDAAASEPLRGILINPGESNQVRLTAAVALGKLHESGLLNLARELVSENSSPSPLQLLMAIALLERDHGADAIELFNELVASEHTIVQSGALQQLFEIDVDLVDRHAPTLIASEDVNVRRWCVRAMVATEQLARIEVLCNVLNDVNPSLRREVAQSLITLAEVPKLRDEVINQTTRILERDEWRGCEQAIIVMARLDHDPSGPRIVELLGHERGEVKVASAWGLTQLRIPELLPDMLEHAESVYDGFRSGVLNDDMPGASLQVAHLFIALGDQRYRPANQLMRQYIPKDFSLGYDSRAAAAWGLGMIYEDDSQDDVTKILVERLADVDSMFPEIDEVRRTSAVSIGRMKSEAALSDLREFANFSDFVSQACYWSIERMTGEEPPPIEPIVNEVGGWFLSPL